MKKHLSGSRGLLSLFDVIRLLILLALFALIGPRAAQAAIVLMIEPSVAPEGVTPTNIGVQNGIYAQNETYTSAQTGGLRFNAKIWLKDDSTGLPVAMDSMVTLTATLSKGANTFNINYGGGVYPGTVPSYQIYDNGNNPVNYPGPVTGTQYVNDDAFSFTLANQFVPATFQSGNYALTNPGDVVGYTLSASARDLNGNSYSAVGLATAALVPEPTTGLLGLLSVGMLCRRKRRAMN